MLVFRLGKLAVCGSNVCAREGARTVRARRGVARVNRRAWSWGFELQRAGADCVVVTKVGGGWALYARNEVEGGGVEGRPVHVFCGTDVHAFPLLHPLSRVLVIFVGRAPALDSFPVLYCLASCWLGAERVVSL